MCVEVRCRQHRKWRALINYLQRVEIPFRAASCGSRDLLKYTECQLAVPNVLFSEVRSTYQNLNQPTIWYVPSTLQLAESLIINSIRRAYITT